MAGIDFSSFLGRVGVTDASANTTSGRNAGATVNFSEYLKKVNYKIDASENKLISDYKAKYIDRQPAKFEIGNKSDKFVQYQSADSNTASKKLSSTTKRQSDNYINTDSRYDIRDSANDVTALSSRDVRQPSNIQNAVDNVKDVKVINGKDVLTQNQQGNGSNLVTKATLTSELTPATQTQNQSNTNNAVSTDDVALEDNFLFASLVYKVFNIMNDTGATDGTTMQGSTLKDFMEMIKQLPQDKMNELRTLIDPENLDITTEDKANATKIKDILLTTNFVIADNSEILANDTVKQPEQITEIDKEKVDKLVAQMLADNGLLTQKTTQTSSDISLVSAEDNIVATSGIDDLTSKVDIKSIKELIADIREEKERERLEKLLATMGMKVEEEGKEGEKGKVAEEQDEKLIDLSSVKDVKLTADLLNKLLQKMQKDLTSEDETKDTSLETIIAKLMSQGLSDDQIADIVKPMVEGDETMLNQLITKLADKLELVDGKFVKVTDDKKVSSDEATFNKQPTANSNELLKNLISSKGENATKQENFVDEKVTAKEAPQVAQNISTKSESKQEAENKANLMKSYEELKVQIEKVVNASSGSENKSDLSQNDKQQQTFLATAKQSNEAVKPAQQPATQTVNNVKAENSLDFNSQMKDVNDLKSDKQFTQDVKQASYNIKDPKEVMRLFKTLEQSMNKGESKVTVSLTPENLGKMEIRLAEVAGKITAKFFTENETSHKLIMAQADLFKNQLSEKGIVIDNMEFNFSDPSAKQGRDGERRANRSGGRKEDKDNIIERDNSINFRRKAERSGGLYA